MTDKTLTDKEIVKALKQCKDCNADLRNSCNGCLLLNYYPYCTENGIDLGVDLINRLQAENERLNAGTDSLFNTLDYRLEQILKLEDNLKTAKAEAYKDLALELKRVKRAYVYKNEIDVIAQSMIDKLN
jgi:hypothetical protein